MDPTLILFLYFFFCPPGEVIRAFELGIGTMRLHEKSVFTCAPQYAYGESGSPPLIPPNATLLMEVRKRKRKRQNLINYIFRFQCELLGWKGEDLSPEQDGSVQRFIIKASEKRRNPDSDSAVKGKLPSIISLSLSLSAPFGLFLQLLFFFFQYI